MNTQASRFLCLIALGLAVAGCTTKSPTPPPYGEIPAGSFAQAWQADLMVGGDDQIVGMDVLADLLVVRTRYNTVFAISAEGGTVRWATQALPPGRILGKPILVGNQIVFPGSDQLVVFDTKGRRIKDIPLARAVRSPLATNGEFVYLGFDYGEQGRLGRVSIGNTYVPIRWELMNRGAVSAAPAVFQDDVYSAGEDGNLYAVNEQRQAVWTGLPGSVFATGGPIVADVKVDDTGVYVASTDSKLYALDRLNGRIRWQYFAGAPLTESPVLTSDSVYVYVPNKGVAALDKVGGKFNREPRWFAEAGSHVIGQDAQYTFVVGGDQLIAVDKKTGQEEFRTTRNDLRLFAPYAPGGKLMFAATRSGSVIGIKPVKTGGTSGQIVIAPQSRENSATLGG